MWHPLAHCHRLVADWSVVIWLGWINSQDHLNLVVKTSLSKALQGFYCPQYNVTHQYQSRYSDRSIVIFDVTSITQVYLSACCMCLLLLWCCLSLVPRFFFVPCRPALSLSVCALCHLTFSSFSHKDKDTSACVEVLYMSAVKLLQTYCVTANICQNVQMFSC